ncbi:MAG: argininosuccinate lyase [Wenzhouxiangellaceae bacterium]|nr:argininosuccinate lyase [Wenzhouxiangellaceae bacterium]
MSEENSGAGTEAPESEPVWKKSGQARVPAAIMRFLAGQDVELDRELLPFDIRASCAHARGLARIGVIGDDEAAAVCRELDALARAFEAGEFVLDRRFEDGHSAIEVWLTERLSETGKRIHTGRSRNDQVAVALRLYLKDRLDRLVGVCCDIAEVALARAGRERDVPMPGHTHLQQAMPSSLGLWWAGHAEAFVDDAELAGLLRGWLDASPLGTASGFGVNIALDRDGVADELGFGRLVVNPQNAQAQRGKVELRALDALAAATGDLRRLAWDLSLYASREFGYANVPAEFCTGSSIMPNKLNPDCVELLRALHASVVGARAELDAVLSLPSGYQRDLQDTKPPLIRAFARGLEGLALVPALLAGIEWNEERMREAIGPAMHATDRANELVAGGMSFRDAYRKVGDELDALGRRDAAESLAARVSPGGCGDLELGRIEARLNEIRANRE